jgi:glutaryl-CoA dehydrogenase
MVPINEFGTEAQKKKYLPKLATGRVDRLLRPDEPNFGSDPGGMITRARKVDGGFQITGTKAWITSSPIADVFIVWAKDDEDEIRGFILEKGWKGLTAPPIHGKGRPADEHHGRDRHGRRVLSGRERVSRRARLKGRSRA